MRAKSIGIFELNLNFQNGSSITRKSQALKNIIDYNSSYEKVLMNLLKFILEIVPEITEMLYISLESSHLIFAVNFLFSSFSNSVEE